MHDHDRYDEFHAALASGEGMPEAPHPPGPAPRLIPAYPAGAGEEEASADAAG